MKANLKKTTPPNPGLVAVLAVAALALAGCQQIQQLQKPSGYYEQPRETTTTDAIRQAETGGSLQTVRAPNQFQMSLKRPMPPGAEAPVDNSVQPDASKAKSEPQQASYELTSKSAAQSDKAHSSSLVETLVPQPQTYFGTLPCFYKEMRCTIQKLTLSLAPNGRWRARSEYLDNASVSGKPFVTQGCWTLLPTHPPSLLILDNKNNVRAEMFFLSRNVLQVKTIDGDTPNLTYTLNRQPDMDPIAELDHVKPLECN